MSKKYSSLMKTRLLFVPLPTFCFRAKKGPPPLFSRRETHISKRPSFPPSLYSSRGNKGVPDSVTFWRLQKKREGKTKGAREKKSAHCILVKKHSHFFIILYFTATKCVFSYRAKPKLQIYKKSKEKREMRSHFFCTKSRRKQNV